MSSAELAEQQARAAANASTYNLFDDGDDAANYEDKKKSREVRRNARDCFLTLDHELTVVIRTTRSLIFSTVFWADTAVFSHLCS